MKLELFLVAIWPPVGRNSAVWEIDKRGSQRRAGRSRRQRRDRSFSAQDSRRQRRERRQSHARAEPTQKMASAELQLTLRGFRFHFAHVYLLTSARCSQF